MMIFAVTAWLTGNEEHGLRFAVIGFLISLVGLQTLYFYLSRFSALTTNLIQFVFLLILLAYHRWYFNGDRINARSWRPSYQGRKSPMNHWCPWTPCALTPRIYTENLTSTILGGHTKSRKTQLVLECSNRLSICRFSEPHKFQRGSFSLPFSIFTCINHQLNHHIWWWHLTTLIYIFDRTNKPYHFSRSEEAWNDRNIRSNGKIQ